MYSYYSDRSAVESSELSAVEVPDVGPQKRQGRGGGREVESFLQFLFRFFFAVAALRPSEGGTHGNF